MRFSAPQMKARAPMSDGQFYLIILVIAAAIIAAILASFALLLHRNFLTIACDSAVIQSGIVNTLSGHWFSNNGAGGPSLIGSHTTFILLLVIPLYVIFPSIDTLFVLQVFGTYLAVIPLYLVARKLTSRPLVALCVAGSAMASPLLLHMALAPIHFETWIAAAALWSYYFYLRGSLLGFAIAIAVAVCCGEQAAMIYIALGAAFLLVNDGRDWRKRFGTISLTAGFLWIMLDILVITPYAGSGHKFNIFGYNYTQWDIHSAGELPLAIAHHPLKALGYQFNPYRWLHILTLVGAPLIISLTSWRSILLLAPAPIYLLMSDQEFFLYFHAYYYTFVFVAGYVGLILLLSRGGSPNRFALTALFSTALVNVFLLILAAHYYQQLGEGADPEFTTQLHEVFAKIPPQATVYSPHRYSAYLANRENLVIGDLREPEVDFNTMVEKRFDETNVHGQQVDYVISDYLTDQCGWRNGEPNSTLFQARSTSIDKMLQSGNWTVTWQANNVFILQRVRK